MQPQQFQILLVEDDDAHAMLIEAALTDDGSPCSIHRAATGRAALEYLQEHADTAHFQPDVILLDLKLTDMNGLEVLKIIKHDRRSLRIPVVLLTSSNAPEDLEQAYQLQVNSYLTKPSGFEDFCDLMKEFKHYWGVLNQRPRDPDRPTLHPRVS